MIDFRKEKNLFFAFRDRQTEQYRPIKVKYVSKVNETLSYLTNEAGTTFIGKTDLIFRLYEDCAFICAAFNHEKKSAITVTYNNNELSSYEFDTLKINRETGFITIERKNKYTAGIVIDSVRSIEIKF